MRSLQRLRHVRPAVQESPFQQARIHKLDTKAVKRRERQIWLRRLRRAVFLVGVAVVSIGAISAVAGSRIVASGLVRASVVVLEAPSDARIARWHVHAGGSVSMGEALVDLEPIQPDGRRAELRARWDASLAQLAWFDAGGELEISGQPQRTDFVVAARRSEALERADARRLAALVPVRFEERRVAEAAVLEAERGLRAAELTGLAREERQSEVLDQAKIEAKQAAVDEARAKKLVAEGIQSERAREGATMSARVGTARVRSLEAELRLAQAQRKGAVDAADAVLLRAKRALETAEARAEAAEAARAAAEARAAAWAQEAEYHGALVPEAPVRPEGVRAARRKRLEAEVRVAKAEYDSHVRVFGDRTVLAQLGGSIDEVLALEGAVVKKGEPLLRYHDPSSMQVVIYATPSATAELSVGDTCTVHCPADGRVGKASILSISRVWIDAPEGLGLSQRENRVAVTLLIEEDVSPFSANAQVKAAFETDRWTAFKQRLLGWFQS